MEFQEKVVMFFLTGLSNLCCFPVLLVIYKRKMVFGTMIGVFTFICSFLYHSMESLEIQEFYLTYSDWHRLDNIGSIMSLIYLFVHLMDNLEYSNGIYLSAHENIIDRVLCYLGLFITLLMQTKHPWNLENTVVPIAIFASITIGKTILYRKPRLHKQNFGFGCAILALGLICFYKGLDDNHDYLRIWHGCWHICGSAALFYFYQSIRKDEKIQGIHIEISHKDEYFTLWATILQVYSCGFWTNKTKIHREV